MFLLLVVIFGCACSNGKSKTPPKKGTEELLEDLANGNERVRVEAIRQLGESKSPSSVFALIVVLKDPSQRIAVAAANALGELNDPQATEPLWAIASDLKQGRDLRFAAARALANLGDRRSVEPLIAALPYAFKEACASLVSLGKPAVPALIGAVRDAATRDNASKVLVAMGATGVEDLIDMLRHGAVDSERWGAAATLAEIPDPRAEEALNEALRKQEPELTWSAYRFLIRKGQPGTEPQLIAALNTYGRKEMAEDFIGSGNLVLKAAAEEWVRKKSFQLAARSSDTVVVYWGGVDPAVKRMALFHFDGSLSGTPGTAPAESRQVTFVPGKWGSAISVGKGGILRYPVAGNLGFRDGTVEMWVSLKFDGADPIYTQYNHVLLLYHSPSTEFLVSRNVLGGFYAGSFVNSEFNGAGGGKVSKWRAGEWHHIAFTYSSHPARQRFYVDGAMTEERTGALPEPKLDANSFAVGCDFWDHLSGFVVDELQISSGEKGQGSILAGALRKDPF
jgi:hypothetical protein